MTLKKMVTEHANEPDSASLKQSIKKDDVIVPNNTNLLNSMGWYSNYSVFSGPPTLILGQGAFLHEQVTYKGSYFVVPCPTFYRYSAEQLEIINKCYDITIKINYFICFDQSAEPGLIACYMFPRYDEQIPEYKTRLNYRPYDSIYLGKDIDHTTELEVEVKNYYLRNKRYKKYPTLSRRIMINTDSNFDKNTLSYQLFCGIDFLKKGYNDTHAHICYEYEIIAERFRDYV